MDEDLESSDITAAQLASIQNKGQFARSISLALSETKEEDSTLSSPAATEDAGASPGNLGTLGIEGVKLTTGKEVEEKDAARVGIEVEDHVSERSHTVHVSDGDDSTTEESSSSSDDSLSEVQMTPLPASTSSHCRRRTQLQKRRLQQSHREFFAPFMRDEDSDQDVASLGTVEGEDRPGRVPTLMELCMQQGIASTGPFPPGLKPMLSHHHNKAKLAALQLRWLSRNLGLLEKQIKWNLVDAFRSHGVKSLQLRRDMRSLWRNGWWSYDEPPHPERARWILPVTCTMYSTVDWKIAALAHYINLTLPHQYSDSYDQSAQSEEQRQHCVDRDVQQVKRCLRKRYPKMVKHCFDHAMAYVWWARGRCTKAQESFMKIAKQYPEDRITDTERSTLWARHRALVLVEIGRLLVTFDRPDTAGQFYREAAEVASRNVHPDEMARLIVQSLALTASAYDQGIMDQHSANQAANLWSAAVQQAKAVGEERPYAPRYDWRNPGEYDIREHGTTKAVLGAMESLLHCHAGHLTDPGSQNLPWSSQWNKAWLSGVRAYLEKLQGGESAFVGLYLSLVLAMLNEGVAAENAYHFSLMSNVWTGHPGEASRMLTEDDIRPHPWWLFHEWITARAAAQGKVLTKPLLILPLVWRRGLQHPSYTKDRMKSTVDVQGVTPDLRITPKGHLTGAMLQNLPPLTKVCIDAYNGQVHFGGSCCEETHRWDNYDEWNQDAGYRSGTSNKDKHDFNCSSALPQPNVIYTDRATSTSVSIVMSGISKYYESEANKHSKWVRTKKTSEKVTENAKMISRESQPAISVVYRSRETVVKVNIVQVFMQKRKNFVLGEISKVKRYDATQKKIAKDLIDYCIARRKNFNLQLIDNFVQQKFRPNQKHAQAQGHASCGEKDFVEYLHSLRYVNMDVQMILKNVLYVGKATVVLLLHMNKHDVLVFLDCTSPRSFSQPVFRVTNELEDSVLQRWILPNGCDCWKAANPTANLLFAFADTVHRPSPTHNKMRIFDERGNILDFEKFTWRKEQDSSKGRCFTACQGHKIIGTNTTKTKITVCDIQTGVECWSAELPNINKMVVSQDTVYVMTGEGFHALDINTLEPLVIVQPKPSAFVSSSNDAGLLLYLPAASSRYLEVLDTSEVMTTSDGTEQYKRTFLGIENHILLLQRRKIEEGQLLEGEQLPNVLEVRDVMIPGKPIELCYINEQAGFVVSATIFHSETDSYYNENLYWFDMAGDIIAIHPLIGGGRHGFLPVYLRDQGAKDDGKVDDRDKDLYLYFADGLGALCCIKLDMLQYR